jgi:hypothetical protein
MDDHALLDCLARTLRREIALATDVASLERAAQAIRAGVERLQTLAPIQVDPTPLPHNDAHMPAFPAAFDMSALVDMSVVSHGPAVLMPYSCADVGVPPELYEPLPSSIADRVFPSFVGFDEQAAFRGCILCGTPVDPSSVSSMSLPGAESLGSIQMCAGCTLASSWTDITRPFDETGRPTAMGLASG